MADETQGRKVMATIEEIKEKVDGMKPYWGNTFVYKMLLDLIRMVEELQARVAELEVITKKCGYPDDDGVEWYPLCRIKELEAQIKGDK